jgi:aspartate/methionine/tyrosine aminotransferase
LGSIALGDGRRGAEFRRGAVTITVGDVTDGRKLDHDSDVAMYLLEREGVAVVAGAAYRLSPYFRLSIATSIETLAEGCKRIARAVAALD